jgi:S2P endopeptidase
MLWFLGAIGILYGMLMFFDFFFKSCMMLPYLEFLKSSGISIRFFRLQFYTTGFNRFVNRWSSKLPVLYRQSFKLGSYVAMLLFPVAICMVIISLFSGSSSNRNTAAATASGSENIARLEILLPGVNLPLNQIGYYIVAMLICSVVHEAGHGIAAVLEDVPVLGFGLQFMFIVPIAFTEIDNDHLQSAKLWKRLKIYSAGIWNNILLAGWSYSVLLLLPIFLSPVFTSGDGVFITEIKPKAPIRGENGLYIGDSITQINGCSVTNEEDFIRCLSESIAHHPAYCVHEDFVHDNEESIHEVEHGKDGTVSCCPQNPALNCFENLDEDRLPQYVCLNIRKTVEHSQDYCHKLACPEHTSCLKPILSNTSTIIHMKRKNRVKDLVYYGHPYDILRNVEISGYIPKTKVFEPWFADALSLLLKYITVFSSGLGIVNVMPCLGLDGYFLVNAVIASVPSISKHRKELISFAINGVGTAALFLSIIKIIYTTFV